MSALLSITAAVVMTAGEVDRGVVVPAAVLELHKSATDASAQRVGAALRSGLRDLAQFATGLALVPDAAGYDAPVKDFAQRYRQFHNVYIVDAARKVVAQTGAAPHPEHLPAKPTKPGMGDAVEVDNVPVVVEYVPFTTAANNPAIVVAEYELASLRFLFASLRPANAWVLNTKGQVVTSSLGFTAFERFKPSTIGRKGLPKGADPIVWITDGGNIEARQVVGFAAISVKEMVGTKTWSLVTVRSVTTVVLPETQARDQALLIGLVLLVTTAGVFSWMYVAWVRPMRRLMVDADRIAHGDLSIPVQIRKQDEIGVVAKSVERIRVALVQDLQSRRQPSEHTQMNWIVSDKARR